MKLLLLVTLCAGCRAATLFTDISGVFLNPAGGVNSGVGTSFFATGSGSPNRIEFTPQAEVLLNGLRPPYDSPSSPVTIGTFSFFNGATQTGTAATSVEFWFDATAILLDLTPNFVRPAGGQLRISFRLTRNVTGDPIQDGDYWTFPGIGSLLIPEDASGSVSAIGRFVPQFVNSPPRSFGMELVGLVPLDRTISFVPVPEANTALFAFAALALCLNRSRRRRPHCTL